MFRRFPRVLCRVGVVCGLLLIALPAYALVNINTAGVDELDTLYGIGPAKAQDIIDYREGPNGPFDTIEEIMNVSGIGPSTFDKIKNDITVGDVSTQQTAQQQSTTTTQTSDPGAASTSSSNSSVVFVSDTKSITVDAGPDRTVFVGADSVFEANVIGAAGDPIENARVVWSFGDGGRREGGKVLYNFAYPGEYVVTVDASNGIYSASDRVRVSAIPALVAITQVTADYIALRNDTKTDVDLGGWLLFSAGKQFQFPQHTVILSGQEVLVSNKRTGLSGADPGTVALQYPNGIVATAYQYPLFIASSRGSAAGPAPALAQAPAAQGAASPDDAPLATQNLITSPIVATGGNIGVWPWLAGIVVLAGAGGALLVYARRRESAYSIEEI